MVAAVLFRRLLLFLLVASALILATPVSSQPSVGRICRGLVPVMASPNTASEQVTQAMLWDKVEVLEVQKGWARVNITDQFRTKRGYPGWIQAEAVELSPVSVGPEWVTVSQPWVALRQSPSNDSPLIGQAYLSARLPLEKAGESGWLSTRLPGGKKAWVRSDHVDFAEVPYARMGRTLVEQAQLFLDTPYLWGGMTKSGIDCSGLVFVVYQRNAVTLPRDADQQFEVGEPVAPEELQAGDLVFFGESDDDITHVGMYAGNGNIIHASSGSGVVISPLFEGWYKEMYRGARRILSEQGGGTRVLAPKSET